MVAQAAKTRKSYKLSKRRSRVVPVVTPARRRLWHKRMESHHWAYLHYMYQKHRKALLPKYFERYRQYDYPKGMVTKAWRWYVGDVLLRANELLKRNGRHVHETCGIPRWRQRLDMIRLSVSLPSMPENYYKFELYRPENRARASEYLHRHETKGVLFKLLSDVSQLDMRSPLTNKVEFVRRAEGAGLSVTPLVAELDEGAVVRAPAELPKFDLFVKPKTGKGGSGAQVWAYDRATDEFRLSSGDESYSRSNLLAVLAERSARRALIVQPRLTNHPDIADVALDAVPTCRMVTITNEAGEGEPVICVFRMPAVAKKVVDNIHAGGIAAPVDIATGVLGKATDLGLAPSGRHSHHPATGEMIEGKSLPYWDDVLKLAAEAHGCFAPRLIAGWDISIGPTGPVLVEGNAQPCVDLLQRPHDLPLGSHRFGELLAYHLRNRFGPP